MLRIICIGVLALLLQGGGPGLAPGQNLALVSPQAINSGTTFWVSLELRNQVPIKVEIFFGNEPVADALSFTATDTKKTVFFRSIPPQNKVELRYTASDPSAVSRIGVSDRLFANGTAFSTQIDAVYCDVANCRVCYQLLDDSNVDFDSYPENKPTPVRNNFDNGARKQGKRQANWDQKADLSNGIAKPVDPGRYFINLVATNSSAPIATRSVSQIFPLPAAPPSAAACQVGP